MQKRKIQLGLMGMNQDVVNAKVNSLLAYEIHNLRLNSTANNNSLELTSERGMLEIGFAQNGDIVVGEIIGYAIIDDYIVLFTHSSSNDYIYRLELTTEQPRDNSEITVFHVVTMYIGDLNFNTGHETETLTQYENQDVLKVYWIDGINQPRVINIAGSDADISNRYKDSNNHYIDDPFSFVLPVTTSSKQILVDKQYTGGLFYAGVVQYAISYYNENAQESSMAYITPLNYISHEDRGELPNKQLGCSFKLTVTIDQSNIDRFEYARIYSINRTSLNTTPVVKVIRDIKLDSLDSNRQYLFIDDNQSGYIFDAAYILIPKSIIYPNTIESKDYKLFVGDYNTNDVIEQAHLWEEQYVLSPQTSSLKQVKNVSYNTKELYPWKNQLSNNSQLVKTFKSNEWYKLGVLFLDKYGIWSEVYPLGTFYNTRKPQYTSQYILLPYLLLLNSDSTIQITPRYLYDLLSSTEKDKYVAVRPVISFPTKSERNVLCQGILNPTVFNLGLRKNHTCYAQSSWFFRPYPSISDNGDGKTYRVNTDDWYYKGFAYSLFKHMEPLYPSNTWGGEMLHMYFDDDDVQTLNDKYSSFTTFTAKRPYKPVYEIDSNTDIYDSFYYVDLNIVTLNSPEIEFDNNVTLSNIDNYLLRIVGAIEFTGLSGRYNIIAQPPLFLNNERDRDALDLGIFNADKDIYKRGLQLARGFYNKRIENLYNPSQYFKQEGTHLSAINCWFDDLCSLVEYKGFVAYGWNNYNYQLAYCVYPWQRQYLNNYGVQSPSRPALFDSNTGFSNEPESSKIITKVDANILVGQTIFSSNNPYELDNPEIKLYNYDTTSILKFDDGNIYYGNVDLLVLCTSEYTSKLLYGYRLYYDSFNNTNYGPFAGWRDAYKDTSDNNTIKQCTSNGYPFIVTPLWMLVNDLYNIDYVVGGGGASSGLPTILLDDVDKANGYYMYGSYNLTYFARLDDTEFGFNGDNPGSIVKINGWESNAKVTGSYGSQDPISVKYKSNPHLVISLPEDSTGAFPYKTILPISSSCRHVHEFSDDDGHSYIDLPWGYREKQFAQTKYDSGIANLTDNSYLWLGEVYRYKSNEENLNPYCDDRDINKLKERIWVPCGDTTSVSVSSVPIKWLEGDTYFLRYDCLKTYPYSNDDYQSVVEIASFMVETHINLDGRYDENRGLYDNTFITNTNFNLLNPVYNQENNLYNYSTSGYNKIINNHSTSVLWSLNKLNGALIDAWTQINTNSSMDLDGDKGRLHRLLRWKNNIYAFLEKGISRIKYNENVALSTKQGIPVELANSAEVTGKEYITELYGIQNKWNAGVANNGIYFYDGHTPGLYHFGADLYGSPFVKNITLNVLLKYIETHNVSRVQYDNITNDVLFTISKTGNTKEMLAYNSGIFTSFYDYQGWIDLFNGHAINIYNKPHINPSNPTDPKLYFMREGARYNEMYGSNILYSVSFIATPQNESGRAGDCIYDNLCYIGDVVKSNELIENTTNTDMPFRLSQSQTRNSWYSTFNNMSCKNTYQESALNTSQYASLAKKKFRVWRIPIPRTSTRSRMRDNWLKIDLKLTDNIEKKFILKDAYVDAFY